LENGDYIYDEKRLRQIDGRIRRLLKRLEIAEIFDPLAQPDKERIFFGATVTYEDQHGKERTIRIVGTDEACIENNEVSWVSPITRALMCKSVGDVASLRTPDGEVEVEVLEIAYEAG
jgi:transcription elongation factor GreB